MRMLAKNELNLVSGGTNALIVTYSSIDWKKDPSGSLVPGWTPDGSLFSDASEGLIMMGYFVYKHYSTIISTVSSILGIGITK